MKLFLIFIFTAALAPVEVVNFDKTRPGDIPEGWMVAMTHAGGAPKWEVLADPTAPSQPNVLAQISTDKTGARFPLAIYERTKPKDGVVSVDFKPVAGTEDQAAGIVWRYQNPDNYYIVRANALEDNVVLYKVEGGKRTALAPKGTPPQTYGVAHKVPKLKWSTLKVQFAGGAFEVFFDGEKIMEVEDRTFTSAGQVGLWTKADSVTYFDSFRVEGK